MLKKIVLKMSLVGFEASEPLNGTYFKQKSESSRLWIFLSALPFLSLLGGEKGQKLKN